MEGEKKHMNSKEVVERLVEENYGLIFYIVQTFIESGSLTIRDFDDAIWYATDGLLKAAQCFNESKGFAFSSYACIAIRNSVIAFIRDKQRHIQHHQEFPVIKDKADREVDPLDLLNPDEVDESTVPEYRRNPLSLLLEKDRKQQINDLVEEASWLGNDYINTFIDYHYCDESQLELASIIGCSQAVISKRNITVKNCQPNSSRKWKNKEIWKFKQSLQELR